MTIQDSQIGDEKMRELILYLAAKSETDPRFSSTKLNKLLFYCDFGAYRQLGRSITGHSYRKLQFGPAPKMMLPILERMKGDQDCVEIERDHFGHAQRRVVALRSPDVSLFTAEELRLADSILEELWESNATEDFIGWKAAALNEIIPYETAFVGDSGLPVSEEEIQFCRSV